MIRLNTSYISELCEMFVRDKRNDLTNDVSKSADEDTQTKQKVIKPHTKLLIFRLCTIHSL